MAKQLQLRRGTTDDHSTFTGVIGEVTVDTDKNVIVVHDGDTEGGFPLALESGNPTQTFKAKDGIASDDVVTVGQLAMQQEATLDDAGFLSATHFINETEILDFSVTNGTLDCGSVE